MSPFQKRLRLQLGAWITLIVFALPLMSWSLVQLGQYEINDESIKEDVHKQTRQACQETLSLMGADVEAGRLPAQLEVRLSGDRGQPEYLMKEAQIVQLACPGYQVSKLCAGLSCEKSALEMTLTWK